jgi:hypothetical protein
MKMNAHANPMPVRSENWQSGQDVIVPTPQAAAEAHMSEGRVTKDWYFSAKSL